MTLRAADARLLLPQPPRSATVVGQLPDWAAGLQLAGIDVVDPDTGAGEVDLVVAPAAELDRALARRAGQMVIVGTGSERLLRKAGYRTQRYLCRSGALGPRLLVPTRYRRALRYVLEQSLPPAAGVGRLRNRGVVCLAGRAPLERLSSRLERVTVAAYRPGPPYPLPVDSVGQPAEWALLLGSGDDLQRAVFQVFVAAQREPRYVVKVARVPGYRTSFDLDEAGLGLAARAGLATAAHVPESLGRDERGGLHVAVESAAVGRPLHELIAGPAASVDKRRLIDDIAGWIVAMACESAQPGGVLIAERVRLRTLGADPTSILGEPQLEAILDRVPAGVPGVLQHNDLGCWNIVAQLPSNFVVVDWESARRPGLPLWDLVYFLVDALLRLGGGRPAVTPQRVLTMLRGTDPASPVLFHWIREMVSALRLPGDAVGAIVTLCLVHHAASPAARGQRLDKWVGPDARDDGLAETTLWRDTVRDFLADPALGVGWARWQT